MERKIEKCEVYVKVESTSLEPLPMRTLPPAEVIGALMMERKGGLRS